MGWMFVLGDCVVCKQPFTFNADRVPSIWVHGTREPVCRACIEFVNQRRLATGFKPLVPLPGAYEPQEV